MEVILQEDFPSLGYVGDKVTVRRGYARNFLIPRAIAVEVSSRNMRALQHQLQEVNAKRKRLRSSAEGRSAELSGLTLEFQLKAGAEGKVFGSVTTRDIEKAFKEKGFAVDRKQLRINEALRGPGSYTVSVKLHTEVSATVPFKILAAVAEAPETGGEAEGAGERRRERKRGGKGRAKRAEQPAADEGSSQDKAADKAES